MHTDEMAHTGRAAARRVRRRAPVRLRAALGVVGAAVAVAAAPGIAASYRATDTGAGPAARAEALGGLQLQGGLLLLCLLLAVGVTAYAWRADGRQSAQAAEALTARLAETRTELADVREAHTVERDTLLRERAALTQRIAALQDSVHGTFVGLSRRTLGLVERQLSFIDALEENEQDPDALDTLFKLDHLAACMRRHSENLLVLAGADQRGAQRRHVALIDVLRGAVSEIEAYHRVVIRPGLPEVRLNGFASGDASHLLAELLENATACSPPAGTVELGGRLLDTGELTLTVRDEGIGITPAARLAEFNERLGEIEPGPPPGEERGLGLYVVARLAGRHGVRVRLYGNGAGLTAEVRVPARLVVTAPDPVAPVDPAAAPRSMVHEPVEHARAAAPPAQPVRPQPVTPGGLPRRTPSAAQGIPHRAPAHPVSPNAPVDAAEVRRRLAGLQQGSREGWRAAAAEGGALRRGVPQQGVRERGVPDRGVPEQRALPQRGTDRT
ncbi:hypothetical protein SRB5_38320 [Streptomyces sp. RB5]|uniref:histidine kinase n=1 Tax=Streptomyces smaragdinus TaxID=2585196 RepID=A0A7K0CL14_9ACTN|nr:ATP-binding protein [Streptomyces smaragdinus]MQY13682.1 hypothetical protein [Streptomyces smaragdinus]